MKRRRRNERFFKGVNNDPLVTLVYTREHYVLRHNSRWWTTPENMRRLNVALARHFNVPVPRLILSLSSDPYKSGGHFKVTRTGRHWMKVTGIKRAGWFSNRGLNNKCEFVTIKTRVAGGDYSVALLLHEWAHYLVFKWWGGGAHDARFCAVLEITNKWYTRRRNKLATRRRQTCVRDV
jgi:hypothetical protein